MVKAVVNVPAPRQHVFSILTDYARYKDWVPGCERSDAVQKSPTVSEADVVINGMKRLTLGLRFEAQPPQSLTFRMVRGKDVKAYAGSYRLMDSADGTGTVVIAELQVDAGGMAPQFMVDRFIRKSFDDVGAALIRHAPKTLATTGVTFAAQQAAVEAKPKRVKHLFRIAKVAGGYQVWVKGETFSLKSGAAPAGR
ncbi:MAG TPA: SRPBCC family protein [Bryobacteraceae bacterium]|nr:SRPBCC family protein [Bryobacteraceae bacterium]